MRRQRLGRTGRANRKICRCSAHRRQICGSGRDEQSPNCQVHSAVPEALRTQNEDGPLFTGTSR
jgi:hypothetical protein